MNFRNLALLFIALLHASVQGQTTDKQVEWGPILNVREVPFMEVVQIGTDDYFTIGYNREADNYTFVHFDKSSKSIKRTYDIAREYSEDGSEIFFEDSKVFGQSVLLFFSAYNKESKKKSLLIREVGTDADIKPLEQISQITTDYPENIIYVISTSKDQSKLGIFTKHSAERKSQVHFEIEVLDQQLEALWREDVTLPYLDKDFSLAQVVVSNQGSAYLAGKHTGDVYIANQRVVKNVSSDEQYKIFQFPSDNSELQELKLNMKGNFIGSLRMVPDHGEDQLTIAGFYGRKSERHFTGVFRAKVDQKTWSETEVILNPLAKEYIENFTLTKSGAQRTEGLMNFYIRDIVVRGNGDIHLVSELYYNKRYVENAGSPQRSEYVMHWRKDISVFEIDENGRVKSFAVVHKRQKSKDQQDFISYSIVPGKNSIYFVFNDHKQTVDKIHKSKVKSSKDCPEMYIAKTSSLTLAEVTGSKVVYYNLGPNDQKVYMMPYYSTSADEGHILVARKNNRISFGTVNGIED